MSIVDAFNNYFEIIPADTDSLKRETYKLRYQIYCLEKGFENPAAYPDGLEYDDYDAHSSHYLIRHHETNAYMATTRLILPDSKNPEKLFPIEVHSRINNAELLKVLRNKNIAELSRFCVSKQFRRRKNERDLLVTNDIDNSRFSSREGGSSAHITLALLACAVRMSAEHNIDYWYALITPALKQVFYTLGVNFVELGPLVEYHGVSVPCVIKVDDMLLSVAKKDLYYWAMLTNKSTLLKPR